MAVDRTSLSAGELRPDRFCSLGKIVALTGLRHLRCLEKWPMIPGQCLSYNPYLYIPEKNSVRACILLHSVPYP
jgi:hypothetical protein